MWMETACRSAYHALPPGTATSHTGVEPDGAASPASALIHVRPVTLAFVAPQYLTCMQCTPQATGLIPQSIASSQKAIPCEMTIGGGVRLAKRRSHHAQEIHFEVGIPWLPGRLLLARPRALRSIPQGDASLPEVGRALPQTNFTPDPSRAQPPPRGLGCWFLRPRVPSRHAGSPSRRGGKGKELGIYASPPGAGMRPAACWRSMSCKRARTGSGSASAAMNSSADVSSTTSSLTFTCRTTRMRRI